jgi:hypothetical protein
MFASSMADFKAAADFASGAAWAETTKTALPASIAAAPNMCVICIANFLHFERLV